MSEEKAIYFKNIKEWRKWLSKYCEKENKIAIIHYRKHTGLPSLSHRESMHEAISFGWIDTTLKKLDENRYIRRFAKRSVNSRWSDNTRRYARMLIKNGRMTLSGLNAYKEGLKKPTYDFGIPKNPDIPKELENKINKNNKIKEKFGKISPSQKRNYYRWILKAKLPETRANRVKLILNEIKNK